MSRPLKLLLIADSPREVELVQRELARSGLDFSLWHAQGEAEFVKALRESPPHVVLADHETPDFCSLKALERLRTERPEVPLIALAGAIGEARAVEIVRQGAADFVSWLKLADLAPAIQRVLLGVERQTAQKNTEASLRNSESRFRAVFEGAGTGIAVEELDGRIIESNHALQQMLGYRPEELRQITRRDFTHSQDHKEDTRHFQRLLSGESPYYQAEKRFVRKDGRIIWGRLTVSMIRDSAGQPQLPIAMIEDITERQRAEEALVQYAAIVESSQDAIISKTFDGIIFGWNPGAERLYGYSAREVNGRHISVILPPDKEEESSQMLERMRRGERIDNFETTRLRKDGTLIHVSVTTSPIKEATGKTIGVSSISRDITDRKRAEAALRKSEAGLARAQQIAHLGSWERDLQTGALTWSDETCRIFGIERQDFDGTYDCFLRCVHPDDRAMVRTAAEEALTSGHPYNVDHRIVLPDGEIRTVNEQAEIVVDEQGKPVLFVGTVLDVTQRKKVEAENQKLAAFPQFNPNPVLELTADGRLHYFNDAALQMAKSLGHQHPSEIVPAETPAIVRECLASGRSRLRHETVIQNRLISWSFFPVQTIHVVHCYAGDITDRQNLEAQLRQSQKMESVGQLAGGIAHDFNNILTVIQGHTSLLTMVAGLPSGALDSAQQIGLAAERAANLTRQLLTFSRRQIIQPKNLDLNEVVNQMTKMLRRLLGEDITLQVNYAPGLPLIHADPGMMEQILLNLSVNARDAMPKGGRLFINTSAVKVDEAYVNQTPEARVGEHVCLTVKDTGAGIAPEHLPHIFEPFFTTKDVGKGTGLGLATVYGVVRQHHGWITVTSKPNQETAFQIFLPATTGKIETLEAGSTTEIKARGGDETILVVEDEEPLRVLVKNVLERYGYKVLAASSGVDALPVWREHKSQIKLLLTDMVMPHGLSGRELAERLLRDQPQLKIIYSSGYSLAVVGTDMVLREGLNFLQKPYHPRKLVQAIRDCLDEK